MVKEGFVFAGNRTGGVPEGVFNWYARMYRTSRLWSAESFVGSLRNECLNVNGVLSLEDARDKMEPSRRTT
jgi:hypothetical protein